MDIDVDFPGYDRDAVKKHMEERFGEWQVASVGTYSSLQLRAAIKDMSRIYGLEYKETNEMMKLFTVDDRKPEDLFRKACGNSAVKKFVVGHSDLVNEMMLMMPAPKAQSVHACATMIFPRDFDMFHWVPIRKVGTEYVTEWEGGEMDAAGFLKQDILGIKQLDKFQEMTHLIKENEHVDIDIFSIPLDDSEVYRYFQEGWTEDNFHFGSRGLTGYCRKMRPENIEDLIAAISLYRPGAMENGFHEDYIKRKNGNDGQPIEYWVGAEQTLKNTYGVIVYQESVMELCRVLGGLSMVEADDVRKAMVKKKYEALHQYHERFVPYYMEHFGVTKEYAESVWTAIDKASSYLFNRCISGKERIKRHSRTNNAWHPTIAEMYRIRHDREWAISTGHKALHSKYAHRGYGKAWSMNENGDLVLNEIVDIRYQGVRETLTIHLEGGETITITGNHKFPTPNGETLAENLKVGDSLYVYDRNVNDWVGGSFTDKHGFNPYTKSSVVEHYELNSEKGHEGFTTKGETNFKKWDKYRSELKKDHCEICGKVHRRLECHHIDGDHANNELENLITVCPSCHKKLHYKMGRTTMGRKGIKTRLEKIVLITHNDPDEVYDVEMANPYHTFTTQQGVVTCNSHAAAYAITGYISQWLKVHYPVEYWSVAFHFAQEGDASRYIAEINKTGVCEVRPVNINVSSKQVVIDFKRRALYWSLMGVKQVAERAAEQIISERKENGQYWSLTDFIGRHKWKGSAITSRVVKNLILSGAFDELEGIREPYGRVELLLKYLAESKSKIDKDDPIIRGCDKFRGISVWWSLMQKQISGLAFFDYEEIFDSYIPKEVFEGYAYREVHDCMEDDHPCDYVVVGGYLSDIDVKTMKNGSQMARVTIENNYEFMEVIVFADCWKNFQSDFIQAKNSLVFVSGQLDYDSRGEHNVLKMNRESVLQVISLDL